MAEPPGCQAFANSIVELQGLSATPECLRDELPVLGGALRCAGSTRRWFLPSRTGWRAISAPSSKIRTSCVWFWTSSDALAGRIRHAVIIAGDRDHALVADPAFDGQHRAVRDRRQRLQARLFLGKGLITTRRVVAWTRGLAMPVRHPSNWAFRSSRFRKVRARKKSCRM